MKGRKPTPTRLKIARGVDKKDPQRINRREPVAPDGRPKCPRYLDGRAKAEWSRICDALESMEMLSPVYAFAIEAYCVAYQRWREAEDNIEENGLTVDSSHGIKRNPACTDSHTYHSEMYRWLTEMGLTPSSKSRVHGKGSTDAKGSRWAKFLDGKKKNA